MTVSTENRLSGPYNGNGATTTFRYDFRIILDGHLLVVLTDADGVSTTLTLNVDYTVSGVGDEEGGSIEAISAPATGETITILRNLPFTQDTDLENQGAFQAQTIEDALDLAVMRDLVLLGRVGNSIHAPDTEEVSMELPPVALRKNAYLLFDANGEPTYVNSQIDARYYGALAADPATRPDGSARQAGDAYFSTTTLGFRVWSGSGWQAAIPPASLTLTNFTETAASAKTVFTISGGYTVGTAFAYLNGVMLAPDEVTMSNGTTAVLASACVIGDEFRLVGYSAFSVADTLSLSSNLSDLPDKTTALTNLGFSAFVQGLKAMASDALFRAGIGAQQANASLTALAAPAYVRGDVIRRGASGLERLALGATGRVLGSNGTDLVYLDTVSAVGLLTTTGAATVGPWALPAGLKRFTVTSNKSSLNGTNGILVQLRVGGTFVTAGYDSRSLQGTLTNQASTAGMIVAGAAASSYWDGAMDFWLHNPATNLWLCRHTGSVVDTASDMVLGSGSIALAGAIDGVRITVTGANTFDAASFNVFY